MNPAIPRIEILNIPIACISIEGGLDEIERLSQQAEPGLVTYVNAHSLNLASRDPEYRRLLRERYLVFKDGVGVGIAARMLGKRFPKNITFTDFSPHILALAAKNHWRVFFLGCAPGVPELAAERLMREIEGLNVVGARDGFTPCHSPEKVVAEIRAARTDLIIAAMGNPVQEKWLAEHILATGARIAVAVGGYLDFAAGNRTRAPEWCTRVGLEWLHRLTHEPTRLWRRYVIGNPEFIARVALSRFNRPS